jgi:hypothetical protein
MAGKMGRDWYDMEKARVMGGRGARISGGEGPAHPRATPALAWMRTV